MVVHCAVAGAFASDSSALSGVEWYATKYDDSKWGKAAASFLEGNNPNSYLCAQASSSGSGLEICRQYEYVRRLHCVYMHVQLCTVQSSPRVLAHATRLGHTCERDKLHVIVL